MKREITAVSCLNETIRKASVTFWGYNIKNNSLSLQSKTEKLLKKKNKNGNIFARIKRLL